MGRRIHLVGAWPGRGPEHAMEVALHQLAPYLDRISDGETGDRHLWITPPLEKLRANPDVEMVHDGDWSDYDHVAKWRVRDGGRLDPDNIRLPYIHAFRNSFPSFQVMRARFDRPDLRFQVGIPMPIDFAVYAFGDAAFTDPGILEAVTEATAREIRRISDEGGDEVLFQFETIIPLVAVCQAAEDEQREVAGRMATTLLDLAGRAPQGARFGTHLCLGDFHHRAYGTMRTVRPLVAVANALARDWPAGRSLDYVHAPFAAGEDPPSSDPDVYAPLAELDLGPDIRFIAGFVHEDLDLPHHRDLLERIEHMAGREVDIAAACGLGRRPDDNQAWDAMRKAVALVDHAAPQAAATTS